MKKILVNNKHNRSDTTSKKFAYVSILTTDDYLPGLLVLDDSLKSVGSQYPLHVLLTSNISKNIVDILEKKIISYSILGQEIINPTDVDIHHRWFPTYSKLAIFDQVQYEKIVYLDVDMLVLRNIDELFKSAHMSATNASGMLPRKKIDRRHLNLNSGLIVIKPSHALFNDMMSKVGKIEILKSGGGDKPIYGSDQDFINAYFPKWPDKHKLHLDHKYNIFHYHLDEYNKLFGYTIDDSPKTISIIHYASYLKPWNVNNNELKDLTSNSEKSLEFKAVKLWIDRFNNMKS
ncbi:MAG: glycosyltransferase [bacterium]